MRYSRQVIGLNPQSPARLLQRVAVENDWPVGRHRFLKPCSSQGISSAAHQSIRLVYQKHCCTKHSNVPLRRQQQQQRTFTSAASIGSGESCASTSPSSGKSLKKGVVQQHILSSSKAEGDSSTTTTAAQSKALQRAAMEADRLSQLAQSSPSSEVGSKENEEQGKKGDNSNVTNSTAALGEELLKMHMAEARKAAKALLRISSIQSLADAILQQDDSERVARVHRAFISIVKWGLSLITAKPADIPMTCSQRSNAAALLEKLLEVVGRAHELELPLHIPLYHQLLLQVVAHSSMMKKKDPVDAILDITAYATNSLDLSSSPKEASAQWLEPLVEQFLVHPNNKEHPRLDHLDRLLHRMRDTLGMKQICFDATLDLLLRLRAVFRKALNDLNKVQYADEAASIVTWLEPSLVNMLNELNQGPTFPSPSSQSKKENLLFDMLLWDQENPSSDEAYATIMSRILRWGLPIRLDDEPARRRRTIHPFDVIVDTILTRDLEDFRAKELASDILQFVRLRSSTDENDTLPELVNVNSSPLNNTIPTCRSGSLNVKDLSKFEGEFSSGDVSRAYVQDEAMDDDFPDITSQVVRWNGDGRPLALTPEYETILGMDDDEDEDSEEDSYKDSQEWDDNFDYGEDFEEFSVEPGEDDDNDDDDEEEENDDDRKK